MLLRLKPSLLPAVGWLIIVTVLLCLPGTEFPNITWLNKIWFDKWVHIGLFLVLVMIWNWSFSNKNNKREKLTRFFVWITVTSLVYGMLMEIVQHYFIPFRAFDIGDIIADAVGCVAGYLLSLRWFIKN